MLCLIKEELVGGVKIEDRLDHSNNEMLEFSIVRRRRRNRSERKLITLGFRRAESHVIRSWREERVQETKKAG